MRPWASGSHLLVFDPPPYRLTHLTEALTRKGHKVSRCDSAEAAVTLLAAPASAASADLLLIRQAEPIEAALDLLVRIRRGSHMPIMVHGTPLTGSRERVAALQLGADDHLDAQMTLPEVLARIQALLRRAAWMSSTTAPRLAQPASEAALSPAIQGGWRLVPHRRAMVRTSGNEAVLLTGAEFELLRLLATAHGEPVDREAISRVVFRRPWQVEDRAVDGLVKRVRRKLREDAIATVRGVGYALRLADAANEASAERSPHAEVEICVSNAV
jgi:DNA-binding response OmpR family regulator